MYIMNNVFCNNSFQSRKSKTINCIGGGLTIAAASAISLLTYNYSKDAEHIRTEEDSAYMIKKLNEKKEKYTQQLTMEKDILIKKDMSTDEFMTKLRELEKNGALYRTNFNFGEKEIPIYIQELRKKQKDIYANLSPEEKQNIYYIRQNILDNVYPALEKEIYLGSTVAQAQKLTSTTIGSRFSNGVRKNSVQLNQQIDSKYAKNVQENSLAVVDVLQRIASSNNIIQTGGVSDENYANAFVDAINNYFSLPEMPYVTDMIANTLKGARDSIANNMSVDEEKEYNLKYQKKINDLETMINQQISEIKEETNKPLSVSSWLTILELIVITIGAGCACTVLANSYLE